MDLSRRIAKNNQKLRVARMWAISNYICNYVDRKIISERYDCPLAIEQAEALAEVASSIVQRSVSPNQFISTKQQDEDEIFKYTEDINKIAKNLKSLYLEEDTLKELGDELHKNYIFETMFYIHNFSNQMNAVLAHSIELTEELELFDLSVVPPNKRKFNQMKFRRTWLEIEKMYKNCKINKIKKNNGVG